MSAITAFFHGRRWHNETYPKVRAFIQAHNQ